VTVWSAHIASRSPYSWYKLDEVSGTTLTDSGGTPVNGVTAASNITHNQTGLIPGDAGGKSKTSAAGAQIDTGVISRDGTTGFTIYGTYKGTTANITGNGEWFRTINTNGVAVRIGATDISITQYGGTTTPTAMGARTLLLDGTAKFYAWIFKQGDQRLYIGDLSGTLTLAGSSSMSPGVAPSGTSVFRFHRNDGSNFLSGSDDDIVFISGADTFAQVQATYYAWLGTPPAPSVPTGLDVDEGVTNLELSWLAAAGSPTGYDVRIDGGAPIDVGNVLVYDFTGLLPESVHTLEVRAYNTGGDSAWASIGGTCLDLPAPTGLVILGSDEDTITLGWDSHLYAEGFEVRIDGGTAEDVGLTTLHMWDGLDPFTMYELEVRAYLSGVFSDWSSLDGDTDAPPPPEGSYTVTLKVGAHEWIITHEDVLDIDAEVHVLDGLKLGWELNESDPWPSQPEPATIDVGFYATNVEELDVDLAIGTPMYAILEDGDGNVFATFHGRVTESRATPIKRKAGLRMLYQIKGDDYTVDLDEATVTITADWPAEAALDRMYRIDQIGRSAGISMVLPGAFGAGQFELLAAGTYTMRQLIAETLRQMILAGPVRYIVAPVVDVDGLLDHFEFVLLENEVDASALPGTFAIIDGLWTIVFPDTEATGVVDVGDVNLNTTWTRLKYRAVNRVKVTGSSITAEAIRPGPPVRLDLQTTLTDQATADLMAELYLPDTDEALGWVADEFLFYAHRHQEGLLPLWFPDHREDPPVTDAYVNPLVLLRIPENINLAGTTALAGQRSKASLEIRERRVEVKFALRRQLPTSAGVDLVTYQWVQDNFPTVTYADVDPGLSYYEARLGKAV
jgi:hypothetical protein